MLQAKLLHVTHVFEVLVLFNYLLHFCDVLLKLGELFFGVLDQLMLGKKFVDFQQIFDLLIIKKITFEFSIFLSLFFIIFNNF